MIEVETELLGGDELERKLKQLVPMIRGEKGFAQNPLRTAIRKASDVVLEKARENAERIDRPGTKTNIPLAIDRAPISVKDRDAFTARGDSLEGYQVGVRTRGSRADLARHWHLIELGHVTKSGGRVPAQPYLRPAAESEFHKVVQVFSDELNKALDKIAAKLRRQGRIE